jgi:hypothetical protein
MEDAHPPLTAAKLEAKVGNRELNARFGFADHRSPITDHLFPPVA